MLWTMTGGISIRIRRVRVAHQNNRFPVIWIQRLVTLKTKRLPLKIEAANSFSMILSWFLCPAFGSLCSRIEVNVRLVTLDYLILVRIGTAICNPGVLLDRPADVRTHKLEL